MSAKSEDPPVDTPVASSASRDASESANSVEGAGEGVTSATGDAAKTSGGKGGNDAAVTTPEEPAAKVVEAIGDTKSEDDAKSAQDGDAKSTKDEDAKSEDGDVRPPGSIRGPNETAAEYLKRTWAPEVEKASMQDWRKLAWHNLRWPLPVIQAFYIQKPENAANSCKSENPRSEGGMGHAGSHEDVGTMKNLQRIAINSEYLYHELLSISSVLTMRELIMLGPPYKLLIHFFPEMQERLAKLKQDMEDAKVKAEAGIPEPPAEDQPTTLKDKPEKGSSPSTKDTESVGAVESDDKEASGDSDADRAALAEARYSHLKVLVDFIEEELSEILTLRNQIADGTQDKIRFEDLWHLFKPGDIIYSKENDFDQLYKVFFVTGGQSLKRSRTREEANELSNLREKVTVRYYIPPELQDEDDEESIEKMLREEGSGIGTWTPFKVDCYLMGFDGENCGPIAMCKKIRAYVGDREISSLPMYPLRFHPKKDELLRAMQARGSKFLFAGGHKSYDGRTLAMKRQESRIEIQSDVYVDFDAYYQSNPIRKPTVGRLLRSKQNAAEEEEIFAPGNTAVYRSLSGHEVDAKLSDNFLTNHRASLERFKPEEDEVSLETLALMPHYVVGYAFQVRQWYHLDIDLVKEIDTESANARAAGFDDLVIPKRYRDLLVALVDSHASGLDRGKEKIKSANVNQKPTQIDLVRGKGQGLIILLHGPPGSGKTSTAETIAAYTRRPLYSITCGDIGTEAVVVEQKLLEHTRRADKWGCVLLLDEADVFLVQRDWSNLQRNALTSIFLRQLEYYAGILFLTTNRPGVIDEAFKSRVHISLRYPSIDLDSTKKMWSNIMNRLEQDNKTSDIKVVFDKEALLDFSQRHYDKCAREGVTWNGRQIRNAFQTAIALGHYERLAKIREAGLTPDEAMATGKKKWRTARLTKANFANIAKTAREFEQYIETLRGSDSVNARESELRYDEFDPERPRARKQYPASGGIRESVHQLQTNVGGTARAKGKGKKVVRVEQPPPEDEEDEEDDDDEELDDLSGDEEED